MMDQASWRMMDFNWVPKIGRASIPGEVRGGLSQMGEGLEQRQKSRNVQSIFR